MRADEQHGGGQVRRPTGEQAEDKSGQNAHEQAKTDGGEIGGGCGMRSGTGAGFS